MKECKFIKPLYRTENATYISEVICKFKDKDIDISDIIVYADNDSIYNLEYNGNDKDIKFKMINIIKKHVRKKLLSYDGKLKLYTFLSLHIPDKALVNYKTNTNNITIYTSDKFKDGYYAYTDGNKHKVYPTREQAIRATLRFTCIKAFSYITGRLYL